MRVLLLADTHGVLDARIAALARQSDLVVHAGDVGSDAVLAELRAATSQVLAVRGNNDVPSKWPRTEHGGLRALTDEARADLPGGQLVVIHGDRIPPGSRHRRLRAMFPAARAIVYGHSHRLIVDDGETPWILNPGAAGRARTFGGPSCLVLDAAVRGWRVEPRRFALTSRGSGGARMIVRRRVFPGPPIP